MSHKISIVRIEPECNSRCRSKKDAEKLLAVITKGSEEESLFYLATGGLCYQPGKVVDPKGRSLLHVAASLGYKKIVEWLLRFKEATLNAKDYESGYTALHRSIFYGQIHVADFLLNYGANLALCDNEGLTPIDHLIKDQCSFMELSVNNPCEVYTWGTNSNYNLGVGTHQQKQTPEVLETFRKEGIFCRNVILEKFHSAFLTASGQIFTCGHGRGGRLGHGNEESQLTPKPIKALQSHSIVQVALGTDHSLFLTSTGSIYSCGTNTYDQLGQQQQVKFSTSPHAVLLNAKSMPKTPVPIGISASRYHSAFWTKHHVYTWGLNAGQIGHIKGDKTIQHPKIVSSLSQKNVIIKQVCSSEGAIVVLTETGEINTLHEYQTRRITKHLDVAKIEVIGGNLDTLVVRGISTQDGFSSKLTERGGHELRVFILTNQGKVYLWEENRGSQLIYCSFSLNREILVNDLTVNKHGIFILDKSGTGYVGNFTSRKDKSYTSPSPGKGKKKMSSTIEEFVARNPCNIMKIKRVPGIFRGTLATTDPKGQNFCVLQMVSNSSLVEIPQISEPTLFNDMKSYFEELDYYDSLIDVVFKVGTRSFPAHKYIISCVSDKLSNRLIKMELDNKELVIEGIDPIIFEQILKYAYTKSCDLLKDGYRFINYSPKIESRYFQMEKESSPYYDDPMISAFSVANSKQKNKKEDKASNNNNNALEALKIAASKLEIHGLSKALENFDFINNVVTLKKNAREPRAPPVFSRKSFPELHDVEIQTEDNKILTAHRCILSARLAYFKSMFSLGWIETQKGQTLSLPVHSNYISVIIDYIYRDEAVAINKSEDIEFVSNVLVLADQMIMPRLVEICERQLAQLLSLKNAMEILQFSFDYNATQLQESACQFISLNMAAFFESRSLSTLSEDCILKLTRYYQDFIPQMKNRSIQTNQMVGEPTFDEIQSHFELKRSDFTTDNLLAEEEEIFNLNKSLNPSSSKKRNRTSSSGERSRKFSGCSLSSMSSDSGNEYNENKRNQSEESDLFNDEFDFEEKTDIGDSILSPELNNDNDVNSNNNNNSLDFFIFDSEKKEKLSSEKIFSKKFSKKSQRERKREIEQNIQSPTIKDDKPKWSGWAIGGTDNDNLTSKDSSPSLLEIIQSESTNSNTKQSNENSKAFKPQRSKKSSWKQLSFTEDNPMSSIASPPINNPWKLKEIKTASVSPPVHPLLSNGNHFQNIVQDQTLQSENLIRAKSKSLTVTQIEEKAIEDLKKFYNANNVYDEKISVIRANVVPMATPVWKRHLNF